MQRCKKGCNAKVESYSAFGDQNMGQYEDTGLRSWLIKKEPIAIGIAIYSNFMNSKTGMIGIPKQTDDFMGGHAVIICGFDDKNKRFILRNSWGVYWGDKGYFYLPYDYISNKELCGDLWIITRVFQ